VQTRTGLIVFTLLAPITVPAYLLFLAAANLIGGAFYIVVEATIARLARRPLAMSRTTMALLALPVLIAAPLAILIHLVLWLVRLAGRALVWIGHWQTDVRSRGAAFAVGCVWALAALWTTVACLNTAMALTLIGQSIKGRALFVEHITRNRTLGDMPPEMQARRRAMLRQLEQNPTAVQPEEHEFFRNLLEDDDVPFALLAQYRLTVCKQLAGLPWFFEPAEISPDGLDHSRLMLGPLVLVWILLIRWPGSWKVLRAGWLRVGAFAVRVAIVVWAVAALLAWQPKTSYPFFWFEDDGLPFGFKLLSPVTWFGLEPTLSWARPEWWLFNAGVGLALLGMVVLIFWLGWRISPMVGFPRYYVAFLASRLLQRKRIAFFSVGAVTLCVAMMIIVISVMGGFVDSIRDRAHGLLGDLVMDGGLLGFPYYEQFIEKLDAGLREPETGEPILIQATPLIHAYGILQMPSLGRTNAVHIWGVRLDEYVRVNEFEEDLFYNIRFGGTHIDPQAQPVWAYNERGIATLPGDMDEHFERYLQSLPPAEQAEARARYRREPGDYFPGPGVLEGPAETPGFVGDPYPGMIIGRDIIGRRMPSGEYRRSPSFPRGAQCVLTVLPLTRTGDVSPEPPPKPAFRYADDSRTGIHEIDSRNVYIKFEELQRLLSMGTLERIDGTLTGARCSQIQIKVVPRIGDDRDALMKIKNRIREIWRAFVDEAPADPIEANLLQQVDVMTWEEMQRSYIAAIEKEKFLVLIMFGVISIVAVFLILCIFYMIVQEKTRDIGIIKSVGGSAEGVAAVFLAYGAGIGLVGCLIGALLGITFVEHINDVQEWLARINPAWRVWSPETYSFDKIPDTWKWNEVLWICLLGIGASIAGATLPALRAARTWPVEALRYE